MDYNIKVYIFFSTIESLLRILLSLFILRLRLTDPPLCGKVIITDKEKNMAGYVCPKSQTLARKWYVTQMLNFIG